MQLNHYTNDYSSDVHEERYTRGSSLNNQFFDIESCYKELVLGIPYPESKIILTQEQSSLLDSLGITHSKNTGYRNGLLSVQLLNNQYLDIASFEVTLINLIDEHTNDPQFQSLINELEHTCMDLESNLTTFTIRELESVLEQRDFLLKQLALLCLPGTFLDRIQDPPSFINTIAPQMGRYIFLYYRDNTYMRRHLSNETKPQKITVQTLLGPAKTPATERFYKRDPRPPTVAYPSISTTGKENNDRAIAEKKTLTAKLYRQIKSRLPHLRDEKKEDIRKYLNSLRPSMKTLREYYLARGDSPEVVNKLVTPENYPYLPKVWITKYQLQLLLDTLDGNEAPHKTYIERELR